MRGGVVFSFLAVLLLAPEGGLADWDDVTVERARLVTEFSPVTGFVDDSFAFDGAGSRLVWIATDAATFARATQFDLVQKRLLREVELGAFTLVPRRLEFAPGGDNLFVVDRAEEQTMALVSADGKVIHRFGPGTEVVQSDCGERDCVAVYRMRPSGRRGSAVHTVEFRSVDDGRRIGRPMRLEVDGSGRSAAMDFQLRYWASGYRYAVGIKGGSWDPRANQRSPDHEAWLDMSRRYFARRVAIQDVLAHRRDMAQFAGFPNRERFVVISPSGASMRRLAAGEADAEQIALPVQLSSYERSSLEQQLLPDGAILFAVRVDPHYRAASTHGRAATAWTDFFLLRADSKQAVRVARVLNRSGRRLIWRGTGTHLAVLLRHRGFARGGESLRLYRF